MKKLTLIFTILLLIFIISIVSPNYHRDNTYENDVVIELEPDMKLIDISWDKGNLWYLTRSMRNDETAETYTFNRNDQSIGKITIIESMTNDFEPPEGYAGE